MKSIKLILTQKTTITMKKIFLLSLLSVFFLSAFCQNSDGATEIITKFNITKHIDDSEIPVRLPYPSFKFGYLIITMDYFGRITCFGLGPTKCFTFSDIFNSRQYRDLPIDAIEKTGEALVEESDELVAKGEYKGSLTKKIAFSDPQSNGQLSFLTSTLGHPNQY